MDQYDRAFYDDLQKEAASTVEDNEDSMTGGENPVEPKAGDPPSDEGTIDASWGENDTPGKKNDPVHLSDAVASSIQESRQKLLDRCFAQKPAAQRAAQSFVSQHLSHAASGDFESRAPLLEGKAKQASACETLRDQVSRVFED